MKIMTNGIPNGVANGISNGSTNGTTKGKSNGSSREVTDGTAKEIDFNLANDHEYMLGGSYTATSRLNYQFYLWKESLHFNTHPSIPLAAEKACIADVATGTATWLTDLAHEMPNAKLNGFDIDLAQAPPQQWLPPNVALKEWSVFDSVPSDMVGIHDIVHVRLLGFVVKNGNPRGILRNLIKLLKPGGYIQWEDFNCPGTSIKFVNNQSFATPAMHAMRKLVYSQGRNNWAVELADTFAEEGLVDARTYHYGDREDLAKANSDQHFLTFEEFALNLQETGQEAEAEVVFRLVRDAHAESLRGAALAMPRVVCVGRKPRGIDGSGGREMS